MEFDEFIEAAWTDHGEHAEDVASRLADSVHLIDSPKHVQAYVRLVTHVYGEHLARWGEGVELLESLGSLVSCADNPACVRAVARAVATLRYADGDRRALERLGRDDRIGALSTAASAFAGQGRFDDALSTFSRALQLAEGGLADDSPATRALAVAGNNLACALEEKPDLSADEARGMVDAARAALRHWKQAGTWLEEERAEYRLARSLLRAGEHAQAMQSARRCVDVCLEHDAPAFEHFFAHMALALAQHAAGDRAAFARSRAKALEYRERVAPAERPPCDAELDTLPAEDPR
jgi:tetratricopeptide (TPR) repeat protein